MFNTEKRYPANDKTNEKLFVMHKILKIFNWLGARAIIFIYVLLLDLHYVKFGTKTCLHLTYVVIKGSNEDTNFILNCNLLIMVLKPKTIWSSVALETNGGVEKAAKPIPHMEGSCFIWGETWSNYAWWMKDSTHEIGLTQNEGYSKTDAQNALTWTGLPGFKSTQS